MSTKIFGWIDVTRIFLAVCLAIALAACGSYPTLKRYSHPLTEHMDIEVRLLQRELLVDTPMTNPMVFGGGLLGAFVAIAVDNATTKRAEAAAARLRDMLVAHSVDENLRTAVQTEVKNELIAAQYKMSYARTTVREDLASEELLSADNVLSLYPRYALTNNLSTLRVSLGLQWYKRNVTTSSNGKPKVKYKTYYYASYEYLLAAPERDGESSRAKRAEYVDRWMSLGAEGFSARILDAMRVNIGLLNRDLENLSVYAAKQRASFSQGGVYSAGLVISRSDERTVIRSKVAPVFFSVENEYVTLRRMK